eukprot:TRINITY_DN6886_c0_g1_i2.p1 TRINITY_DN6886_c0_g1~~TRINITY_DN6886_c0_g1_i2.p1  ORF type:complete len:180 (+),score=66.16 TRINITY_DN6886_c0_g1_i2:3-542(+)
MVLGTGVSAYNLMINNERSQLGEGAPSTDLFGPVFKTLRVLYRERLHLAACEGILYEKSDSLCIPDMRSLMQQEKLPLGHVLKDLYTMQCSTTGAKLGCCKDHSCKLSLCWAGFSKHSPELKKYNRDKQARKRRAHMAKVERKVKAAEKRFRKGQEVNCLLYTSPSPRDRTRSRMPSSA